MKHTAGPWMYGHFADESHSCNCTSILAEGYFGSVCNISVDNGKRVGDGGNDSPALEEAKANAYLIAAAPDLLEALVDVREFLVDATSDNAQAVADKIDRAFTLATEGRK